VVHEWGSGGSSSSNGGSGEATGVAINAADDPSACVRVDANGHPIMDDQVRPI